jgi:hypothetical protein
MSVGIVGPVSWFRNFWIPKKNKNTEKRGVGTHPEEDVKALFVASFVRPTFGHTHTHTDNILVDSDFDYTVACRYLGISLNTLAGHYIAKLYCY